MESLSPRDAAFIAEEMSRIQDDGRYPTEVKQAADIEAQARAFLEG